MVNKTVLWRRGNGSFTRHTMTVSGDGSNVPQLKRYARDVLNASETIAAIEIYDDSGGWKIEHDPVATVCREDIYRCVA